MDEWKTAIPSNFVCVCASECHWFGSFCTLSKTWGHQLRWSRTLFYLLKQTLKLSPSSIRREVSACASPFCVSTEKSELPWIRPSSFHVLCPCLTRTTLFAAPMAGNGSDASFRGEIVRSGFEGGDFFSICCTQQILRFLVLLLNKGLWMWWLNARESIWDFFFLLLNLRPWFLRKWMEEMENLFSLSVFTLRGKTERNQIKRSFGKRPCLIFQIWKAP